MLNRIKQYDWKNYNYSLVAIVVVLCLISCYTVKLAGGADKGMSLMKGQFVGMILGLFIVAVVSMIDYHFVCRFAIFYYIFGLLLTAATHTPLGSSGSTDAVRWIRVGGFSFQPAELMKVIFIVFLASMFVNFQKRMDKISTLLITALVTVIPMLLILTQPDLSSSLVVLFIMVAMAFAAGLSYKIIVPILAIGIPFSLVGFWIIQQPFCVSLHLLTKYQYNRIQAWLHPGMEQAKDINWQQNHSVRAIAEGQIYGKFLKDGAKDGISRAYDGVAVNESDFIWSVIGEEFGFLGCCLILLLLGIVIFKCFLVAKRAQDYLGLLIAVGVASMFMFQIFCNISVATLIFPNTGLPLPFLSNGLSSMMSCMIGIGLVVNVGIQPAKSKKGGFTMRTAYTDSDHDIDIDFDL